ncbi:GGDEF domain-containing protein [Bacillus sp. Marseille-Q3570]|uniref:GGDEF domain-containing protein n=1 Tax=Bacillus sp. Marseille-Q3570 TaxID=2963522 RepID=UPI0021B7C573|nr:diguanylate cyclase [Bacillus sp. Marseille-Q3570]
MDVLHKIKEPVNVYISAVMALGIVLTSTILLNNFSLVLPGSVLLLFLSAILLLEFYTILMPPKGNSLSMDSPVYIGCLFLFGLQASLQVLLIASILFLILERKASWWKHLFNFSNYSLMLIGSFLTFKWLGGELGILSIGILLPYIAGTSVYFLINVIVIGFYFFIKLSKGVMNEFRGVIKEASSSYLITLVLSLILCFMIKVNVYVGLALFTTMGFLLSIAFKQYFTLYQTVAKKANRDYLTGLYNHGYFIELLDEKVKEAIQRDEPISMAILDLDDFKKFNDTFGHLEGDNLLKHVGNLILSESRDNDVVARYGGEEFVILMLNTNESLAFQRLNALRKKVNDTFYKGVDVLPYGCLSFSGGVYEYKEGTSADFLYKTDQAMYLAKRKGKNMIKRYEDEDRYDHGVLSEDKMQIAKQHVNIFLTKDLMTYRHSNRVFDYAYEFGKRLDLRKKNWIFWR